MVAESLLGLHFHESISQNMQQISQELHGSRKKVADQSPQTGTNTEEHTVAQCPYDAALGYTHNYTVPMTQHSAIQTSTHSAFDAEIGCSEFLPYEMD